MPSSVKERPSTVSADKFYLSSLCNKNTTGYYHIHPITKEDCVSNNDQLLLYTSLLFDMCLNFLSTLFYVLFYLGTNNTYSGGVVDHSTSRTHVRVVIVNSIFLIFMEYDLLY